MLVTPEGFTALLQSLGLTGSFFKPAPALVDSIGSGLQSGAHDCQVEVYDVPAVSASFEPFDSVKANIYRYRQQQSVNLGSWFVHEDWMTPSVFTCASGKKSAELDIASGWKSVTNARMLLERHWDTFITPADFAYLAGIGINTVRLPIGYWSLGPEHCAGTVFEPVADVYRNSWPRLVRAVNMAAAVGIGVLVDLHGAPGSQNGQAHSGVSDGVANLFNDPWNQEKAMEILKFLAQQFSTVTNVVGIQILNEPKNDPKLRDFYSQAITAMRAVSAEAQSLPLYVHDGFNLAEFSAYVAGRKDFVVEDHHSYYVFTPKDDAESASDHSVDIKTSESNSLETASDQERRNLVVGEWSCALTPESLAQEDDQDAARKEFCTGQMDVYTNETAGWMFWSYKLESNDAGWSFKDAVGQSLPDTFFSYGERTNEAEKLLPVSSVVASMKPATAPATHAAVLPSLALQWASPADKRATIPQHHRIASERRRRSGHDAALTQIHARDDASMDTARSSTKGYSDGFATVKIFAAYAMSKLGFIDQYISDSISALGPAVVAPGTEGAYRDGFLKGLREAEAIIQAAI